MVGFAGIVRSRFVLLPLAAWLVVVLAAACGWWWLARDSRGALEARFQARATNVAGFVAHHVADLIQREREQATRFLAAPVVDDADFARSVAAFGYRAAVLLDDRGRLLHVAPPAAEQRGRDLTVAYPHLRTAVRDNRPAVSPVVPAVARGTPVVAFATPFDTPHGRRVFSGAVEIDSGPLGTYLGHAVALPGSAVYLVDVNGMIVSTGHPRPAPTGRLDAHAGALVTAMRAGDSGPVTVHGRAHYFTHRAVPDTPWRLVVTVPQATLYQPLRSVTTGVQVAGTTVAGLGLIAAVYAGRARRGRASLRTSEQRFRGLFENTMVGMVFTAPDGRFLTVNEALCHMVGYSAAELEHGGWYTLTHPDDRASSAQQVAEVLDGRRRGFRLAKRYLHADGRVIHVEVTSTLLRDEHDQPLHFVTQIVDVSERHRLQEQQRQIQHAVAEQAARLRRSNSELQDANRRIADLVTMLTHDVRQPLGSIVGYCALLLDGWNDSSDAEKQADVRRLAAAGRSANELVEEVLTLTQLDADAARPSTTSVCLRSALTEAVDVLAPEERTAITIDAPADLAVLADPRHLHQILVNLISNACKYGAAPIQLASARDGDTVQVSVSDAGDGVPAEFVPRLFDRFTRASTGVAPKRKGTGVGLYIVRQLAEANGASIRYQPNRPRGSTFVVRLPATRTADARPRPQ